MKRLKIVYIIDSFGRGGRERQLQYIIQNLCMMHDIHIWILSVAMEYDLPLGQDRIHVITNQDSKKVRTIVQVVKEISLIRPDVVYYWDIISGIYASVYKASFGGPIINGSIRFGGSLKKSMINKAIRGFLYRYSDAIVANSRAGLRVEGLDKCPKSTILYNGIDFVQFDSCRSSIRNELGIPSDAIVIVIVAGFRPAKDYDTLIRAALNTRREYDNVYYLLVGDGPTKPDFVKTAGDNGLKNVLFLGMRRDIHNILHGSDIGILLSNTDGHAEGLSNTIMEYMASGLPVIATSAGGNPELVNDGETGYLVKPFDANQVAERIASLIDNNAMRKEMGSKARERIKDEFSIDVMIGNHTELLHHVKAARNRKQLEE